MKPVILAVATALLLAGCSVPAASSIPESGTSAPSSEAAAASSTEGATEIRSAPGMMVGSMTVLKNYLFQYVDADCTGWQMKNMSGDYLEFGECLDQDTFIWRFDSLEQRDALLLEIQEKGLPMLVSNEWVIASPLDLTYFQEEHGGALNQP